MDPSQAVAVCLSLYFPVEMGSFIKRQDKLSRYVGIFL